MQPRSWRSIAKVLRALPDEARLVHRAANLQTSNKARRRQRRARKRRISGKLERHGQVYDIDRGRGADADRQYRHGHDHPQAISEDDQAHWAWRGPVCGDALSRGWIRASRFRAQQARLSQGVDHCGGHNFGCGSSREHAPWALLDFGIRCVVATDFADIFYNNCFKNGILPIKVSREDHAKLMDDAERGANATLTIDLPAQEIRGPDGGVVKFETRRLPQTVSDRRPRSHRPHPGRGAGDRSA